jgi:hypothetical protein
MTAMSLLTATMVATAAAESTPIFKGYGPGAGDDAIAGQSWAAAKQFCEDRGAKLPTAEQAIQYGEQFNEAKQGHCCFWLDEQVLQPFTGIADPKFSDLLAEWSGYAISVGTTLQPDTRQNEYAVEDPATQDMCISAEDFNTHFRWRLCGHSRNTMCVTVPEAEGIVGYEQGFAHALGGSQQMVSDAVAGWRHSKQGSSSRMIGVVAHAEAGTPDGDGFYVTNNGGESMSKMVTAGEGTVTITAKARLLENLELSATWASSWAGGVRFVVNVGDSWYGSEQLGDGGDDHGAMSGTEVTEWVVDSRVNLETSNWFKSLSGAPTTYEWRDGVQWSTEPVVVGGGLPAADVLQFGIAWMQTGNGHYGALDNFKVLGLSAGTLMAAGKTVEPTATPTSNPTTTDPTAAPTLVPAPATGLFDCDTSVNFVPDQSYSQISLTDGCSDGVCDANPVYGGPNDASKAIAHCEQECTQRSGCTGFFFQTHTNGHEICGFYSDVVGQGVWSGHRNGAVCTKADSAATPITAVEDAAATVASKTLQKFAEWYTSVVTTLAHFTPGEIATLRSLAAGDAAEADGGRRQRQAVIRGRAVLH